MRDGILSHPHFQWIICGALGIVRGLLSSSRLNAFLFPPIEVEGISDEYLKDLFESRINAFGTQSYYLPIEINHYTILSNIFKGNIRKTLNYIDVYCRWIDEEGVKPQTTDEKEEYFQKWLKYEREEKIKALNKNLLLKFKSGIR